MRGRDHPLPPEPRTGAAGGEAEFGVECEEVHRMNPLDPLLKELAEADKAVQAPPRVEAALLSAFRKKPARRWSWWWTMAAAAAAATLAVVAFGTFRTAPKQQASAQPPKPVVQVAATAAPPAPPAVRPTKPVVRARKAPRPAPPPAETVTEFIPVTPGEPIAADEAPRVVRMRLPASALASFGFRVLDGRASERVQADVMLRQDGSPSAIRLVNSAVFR
jgi:hypothetical protein